MMTSPTRCRRASGFTLIEIMIVIALIAILSAIAYPSYVNYVMRGHRSQAKTQLLQAAQFFERFHTLNNSYAGAYSSLPAGIAQVPSNGTTQYLIQYAAPGDSSSTYLLFAQPVTGGMMAKDSCNDLAVDQTGAEYVLVNGANNSALVPQCWPR